MLGHLLDTRKIIFISVMLALTAAVFLFNIYLLIGVSLLVLLSLRFGIRNVVLVFTISGYFIITSDVDEGLRNFINISNLLCLISVFIYFKRSGSKTLESIPDGIKIFISVVTVSLIISSVLSDFPEISISALIRQMLFLIICFIYFSFLKTRRDYQILIFSIISIALVLGAGIIYQILNEGLSLYYLESINAVRFSGLYNNPNAVGLFFTVSIPLLFSFLFNNIIIANSGRKTLLVLILSFMMICLLITNSRASIMAVIVSIGFILFTFRRKLILKIVTGLAAIILVVLVIPTVQEYFLFYIRADRIFSNTRTYFWSVAFEIIKNNPVFGVGPGAFEQYIYKYLPVSLGSFFEHQMDMARSGTAHNFFLFRTADLGIAGLITGIWLFVLFFKYSNRSIQYFRDKNAEFYLLSVTIKSIGMGLLVRAFFESTGIMTHGWITRDLPFWLIFIILISIYQKIPSNIITEN